MQKHPAHVLMSCVQYVLGVSGHNTLGLNKAVLTCSIQVILKACSANMFGQGNSQETQTGQALQAGPGAAAVLHV